MTDPSLDTPDLADIPRLVRGRLVAVLGQPASMGRREMTQLIERFGGRYTYGGAGEDGADGISLLVVCQKEWPLTRWGDLVGRLRRDRVAIRRYGRSTRIVSEERFLEALGVLGEYTPHREYTTAMVAESLDISLHRLRQWVKAGLVTPTREEAGVCYFDFRQVTAAKTLSDLLRNGVSLRHVRKSLERLRGWMPGDVAQAMRQLSILERYGGLLFRLPDGDLAAADGQFYLDFDDARPAAEDGAEGHDEPRDAYALPLEYTPMRIGAETAGTPCPSYRQFPRDAAGWWALGVEQQNSGYLCEAAESYRAALRGGGPDAQLCFDLARVLHAIGHHPQASERYLQAVEIEPRLGDAWNNLGLLLVEMSKRDEACQCFRQALEIDRTNSRARYNLADTLDEMGLSKEAKAHWREYLKYDNTSEWAAHARERGACTG